MSRKLPKSLQSWLIPKLRRISMQWPGKGIAREKARRVVEIGTYKNGNVMTKVVYECAECVRQNRKDFLYEKDFTHMDHKISVVGINGFTNWDNYLNTLFCNPDNYQCLCIEHHLEKSQKENKERHEHKRSNKKSKRKT